MTNAVDGINQLHQTLHRHRIRCGTEKAMQDDVEAVLSTYGVEFIREYRLAPGPIDFLVGRIGIECKIEGSLNEVLRQCRGYLGCPELDGLLLVTKRAVHTAAPSELGKKPFRVLWVAGVSL